MNSDIKKGEPGKAALPMCLSLRILKLIAVGYKIECPRFGSAKSVCLCKKCVHVQKCTILISYVRTFVKAQIQSSV